MKTFCLFAALICSTCAESENPLSKVIQLLDELAAKVTADGDAEAKAYKEYVEWCDDVSANTRNDIKTLKSDKAKLEAAIADLTSKIDSGNSKIEDLAGSIAAATKELDDANTIRKKEVEEFEKNQAELVDAIDTLSRAIAVLQREMSKSGAALAQLDMKNMASVIQSLTAVVDAASFDSADKNKLIALVQSRENSEDDDAGAPAAAVYQSHSGNIFDMLADLKDKAEGELSDLRKANTNTAHNHQMLVQSLEDQIAADTKDMDEEKAAKSAAEEGRATAEGDLADTEKNLKAAEDKLHKANSDCMQVAADHEATVNARNQELKTIADAKKILNDTSAGAVAQTYSFFQLKTHADLAGSEVIALVKKLAKDQHSSALAQLASKINAVMRYGANNKNDVFGKVIGLIKDLIAKLEAEGAAAATEKAYCDEQLKKTSEKQSELNDDIAKLQSKIDTKSAKSAELKSEVKELQASLAALAKEQADMDKMRSDEHAAYTTAKADLELGLSGVRQALEVLRDYYGNSGALLQQPEPAKPATFNKAEGAGQSIVGILEVVESDFASNLAKEETEEEDAKSVYDDQTQQNAISKTEMDQSVKYKTQEFTGLDKAVSDLSSDLATVNTELAAVDEYMSQIKARCIAVPETYEERKKRREAEIAGLKQALEILNTETASFVQRKFRGVQSRLVA